jgi:chromosomal replication initiation ATPase DnaA
MDVTTGLAPQALKRAMVALRLEAPGDSDTIDRLFHYLEHARPTMSEIREVVCDFYAVSAVEMMTPDRRKPVVLARQVFCFFSYRYARTSLHQIKRWSGHTDHSTVHQSVRRVEQLAITQHLVRDDLDLIRLRICEKLLLREGSPC